MTKKTYEEQNTNFMPNKALQLYKQTEAHHLSEFLHCLVLALTTSTMLLCRPLSQHILRILNPSLFSVFPLPHAPNTNLEDQSTFSDGMGGC